MKASDAVTIEMLQQELTLLKAQEETGTHRLIRNPSLKLLWQKNFKYTEAVMWDTFWHVFPKDLEPDEMRRAVEGLLKTSEQREAFQKAFDVSNATDYIKVVELGKAFSSDDDLIMRIAEMASVSLAPQPKTLRSYSSRLSRSFNRTVSNPKPLTALGPMRLPPVTDYFRSVPNLRFGLLRRVIQIVRHS